MIRITKKIFFGKISYVEISTKEDGDSLFVEIQDEAGGIGHIDLDYEVAVKLSKLINEMAKEIKNQPDWR